MRTFFAAIAALALSFSSVHAYDADGKGAFIEMSRAAQYGACIDIDAAAGKDQGWLDSQENSIANMLSFMGDWAPPISDPKTMAEFMGFDLDGMVEDKIGFSLPFSLWSVLTLTPLLKTIAPVTQIVSCPIAGALGWGLPESEQIAYYKF